ncbi:glycerate kinase [Agromyces aureus]|uniref:Glycerate kinase n=1 Tax=Agromyces aureus TaxID=453304 RepID=A0A191WD42_9MICO|nr:glycerate kinase [Agromyces aureus]ANJ26190.1 glycerate kinase [Agromyces aureus]
MSRRVVFAPDSFKGTVDAADAAAALARGWRAERPDDELVLRPMADGGEGTLDAFAAAVPGAERVALEVAPPAPGQPVVGTSWLRLPDGTAVVELAATCGLGLVDPLQPFDAHTSGFGEAIAAALDSGATRLLLGLGGSASTDGGTGALTVLGARFLDGDGRPVLLGSRGLASVASVDLSGLRALPPGGVLILGDVTNPLLGPSGAAAVFGPQKGADAATVDVLEANLARLAPLVEAAVEPPASGALAEAPGSGAAGGTGFGLLAWGASMGAGARLVAEAVGLADALAGADLVVTGEGRFDGQSEAGKAPTEVAALARAAGVPVALVAGSITADASAFAASVALVDLAGGGAAAMAEPVRWLEAAGAALAREHA